MRFDVVTLFPEMFPALTQWGITGRACEQGLASVNLWNPRDYCSDPRKTVDDRPYGGGPGMVMMAKPLEDTISAVRAAHQTQQVQSGPICLLAPQGEVFSQKIATDILNYGNLTFICGRYEAVDQRFIDRNVDLQLSMGDFVVSGGELPAMVCIDAITRQISGVLHDNDSLEENRIASHEIYARPEVYEYQGKKYKVPKVLLSGNHKEIDAWRTKKENIIGKKKSKNVSEA